MYTVEVVICECAPAVEVTCKCIQVEVVTCEWAVEEETCKCKPKVVAGDL